MILPSYLEHSIVAVQAQFAGWLSPVHGSPEVLNSGEGDHLLGLPVPVLATEPPSTQVFRTELER